MQSIIVYRNPLEAAFWDSMMNGGFVVVLAVMAAALVSVGVYVQIEKLHQHAYVKWRYTGRSYKAIATLYLHVGKISIACSLLFLYTLHLWNIHG